MRKAILLALILPAHGGLAHAAYDDVGVGARVTGMGNAFTAVADDAYAVYYNPAGLGLLDRPELATTYSKLLSGLSDNSNLQNSFLAYSHPIDQGRLGAYGFAWNYFTLDTLYHETSLFGSYGKRILPELAPNGLYAGVSLKYLNRSVGHVSAADNSFTNTGQVLVGVQDPVLQKGSKTNLDSDVGLLYRLAPRVTLGLAVQHLTQPNIAISGSDTDILGRNYKLGAAYRTAWTTLSSDLDFVRSPIGTTDKVLTLAVEKWLPTLLHGDFGVRGAVGAGDRQYRQIAMGLSYRIHRMQVDYGFSIPLGSVSNTIGTHRVGVTFRFGRPTGAEPRIAEALLENMSLLGEAGTLEFKAQEQNLERYVLAARQEFLRQARIEAGEARFGAAREKLAQAASLSPGDKALAESVDRMTIVAAVYPDMAGFRTDAAMAALYLGVLDFLSQKDQEAVRKLAYAESLGPSDARAAQLIRIIEAKTGRRVPEQVQVSSPAPVQVSSPTAQVPPSSVAQSSAAAAPEASGASRDLALSEVALWEKDYDKAVELSRKVLAVDPNNTLAWKRLARAYFEKKDYVKALEALENGARLESDPEVRHSLDTYIGALQSLIERKTRSAARPAGATEARPAGTKADPAEIRRMYEAGVDLYSQGRLSEAVKMFQRILELDPKNKSAAQALRRVQSELHE